MAGKQDTGKNDTGKRGGDQQNEGEGNRTAARQYDKAAEAFAKSGQVEEKAREARDALDGKEGDELRRAEREGKSHVAEEDPKVKGR